MNVFDNPYVIFDFDGTLADSNSVYVDLCAAYFNENGFTLSEDFLESAKVLSLPLLAQALSNAVGNKTSVRDTAIKNDLYLDDYYGNRVVLKPHAEACLKKLAARGVKMCIVSATDARYIRKAIAYLGIQEYFIDVVTPEQVGNLGKEKPDIFIEAAKRLGETDPSKITVYDDTFEALRAASSAGFKTVGVYDVIGAKQTQDIKKICDAYIYSFEDC